jgi:DNA mismatch repair protein MutH
MKRVPLEDPSAENDVDRVDTSAPSVPRSEGELFARASALAGHTLGEIARALGTEIGDDGVRTKGKWGALVERALGATGGSSKVTDFPHLGVELKTVPVRADGKPFESTYVCVLELVRADDLVWETSWARKKLSRVLWVPILAEAADWRDRPLGRPVLWSPSEEQEAILRADFDEIVGAFGSGRIRDVTAHWGTYLQVRPKAKNGEKTFVTTDAEGELVATVPKGFYLRPKLVGALLHDPRALPR